MKKSIRIYLGLFGLLWALIGHAAGGYTPGQRLSQTEISELRDLPEYKIGKMRVRVISPHSGGDVTWLLNTRGIVGSSRNQIMLIDVQPDKQKTVQYTQPHPVSVQYHEQTGIMVSTYANFSQTVAALQALKAALPDAKVALPMVFDQQTLH